MIVKSSSYCYCSAFSFQQQLLKRPITSRSAGTVTFTRTTAGTTIRLLNLHPHYSTCYHSKQNTKPYTLYLDRNQINENVNDNTAQSKDYFTISNIEKQLQSIENQAKILNGYKKINLNSPKQISNALYKECKRIGESSSAAAVDAGIGGRGGDVSGTKTTKEILQQFASYNSDNISGIDGSKQHEIALFQKEFSCLVLQYREMKQLKQSYQKKKKSYSIEKNTMYGNSNDYQGQKIMRTLLNSFSTVATVDNSDCKSNNENYEDNDDDEEETEDTEEDKSMNATSITSSHQHHHTTKTAYDAAVESLFSSSASKINEYWHDPLKMISKPSAQAIVHQLNCYCPMGYDPTATPYDSMIESGSSTNSSKNNNAVTTRTTTAGKKGSLLSYVRDQKEKYSDCIIITRVGEFYEAFGIDALLLIEHCGLNSMAGKARAGCPLKNIQATLDCLTDAGYRVAVYEEVTDTDASLGGKGISGGPKSRIKNRMLAQIVSPASPTYLYNLILSDSGSSSDTLFSTPSARPYVGIISNASSGYTVVEVSSEERTVRVSEQLTTEAVACRLSAYPPAEPLVYVMAPGEESRTLPFLPSVTDTIRDGPGTKSHVKYLQANLYLPSPQEGISDVERAKMCIVSALLQMTEINDAERNSLTHNDFTLLPSSSVPNTSSDSVNTNPLYAETATQLGLMSDPTIPQLVKFLVPDTAPLPTKRFLRRWLLTPPPPVVTSSMAKLVATLKEEDISLPPMTVPPVGKILALIRAGQASAQVFRDIVTTIESSVNVLDSYHDDSDLVSPLMSILRYESGIDAEKNNLKERCLDAMHIILKVVSTDHYADKDSEKDRISSNGNDAIPYNFFERNELPWRGRIKQENAAEAYVNVENASNALVEAVIIDFWGASSSDSISSAKETKSPVVQDIFNNFIALKEIPSWASDSKEKYHHPRDRNGKLLRNRFTTSRVENAIASYIEACDLAVAEVSSVLSKLSETLCETGHLPAISQASHMNLILSTAANHAAMANQLGWNMAKISDESTEYHFQQLWPYWMDKSESVLNTFDLDGMFLLTAPNMSGKSTIMRSTAAVALLTNCGLCSPIEFGLSPRFDNIFVRGASSDVPIENKSAFGAEMQDISALLRACGDRSLVFVDELGRGTSPSDGTSLAAAVLEEMASKEMKGFFATHLHGILDLPLSDKAQCNIRKKMMETSSESWTYKIIDGVCTNSQAFKTASKFGIPDRIIKRAEYFSQYTSKDVNIPTILSNSSDKSSLINDPVDDQIQRALSIIEAYSYKAIHIAPNWTPPPSLEGNSVVYVMVVNGRYYIGETDSLARRIRQHRSKVGWSNGSTIAVKVEGGKTNSRNLESLLIRRFASEGLPLISITDGQTIRRQNRQIER